MATREMIIAAYHKEYKRQQQIEYLVPEYAKSDAPPTSTSPRRKRKLPTLSAPQTTTSFKEPQKKLKAPSQKDSLVLKKGQNVSQEKQQKTRTATVHDVPVSLQKKNNICNDNTKKKRNINIHDCEDDNRNELRKTKTKKNNTNKKALHIFDVMSNRNVVRGNNNDDCDVNDDDDDTRTRMQIKHLLNSQNQKVDSEFHYFENISSLNEFIGNMKARNELSMRLNPQNSAMYKRDGILFLYGPTGTGKTLLLNLLARQYGFDIVNYDPCDFPNYLDLFRSVSLGLSRSRTLIIVDPVEAINFAKDNTSDGNNDTRDGHTVGRNNNFDDDADGDTETCTKKKRVSKKDEHTKFTQSLRDLNEDAVNRAAKVVFVCTSDRSPIFHHIRHILPHTSHIPFFAPPPTAIMLRYMQLKNKYTNYKKSIFSDAPSSLCLNIAKLPRLTIEKYTYLCNGDIRAFESMLWLAAGSSKYSSQFESPNYAHLLHDESDNNVHGNRGGRNLMNAEPYARSSNNNNSDDNNTIDLGRFDVAQKILSPLKYSLRQTMDIVDKNHDKDALQAMSMTFENYLNAIHSSSNNETMTLDAAHTAADRMSLADTFSYPGLQEPTLHQIEGITFHTAPRYACNLKYRKENNDMYLQVHKVVYGQLAQHVYNSFQNNNNISKNSTIHKKRLFNFANGKSNDVNAHIPMTPLENEFAHYYF